MSNLENTSQVTSKITSNNVEKVKDPKRVEQGKKLAAISKAAKEKKAREKFESEAAADREESSWNIDYGYIIGTVGVVTAVGALYFAYRQDRAQAVQPATLCAVAKTDHERLIRKEKTRLDVFD